MSDWERFQSLLDNARAIMRMRYTVLAHYDHGAAEVRLVAFSGRNAALTKAQALVGKLVPQFDVLKTHFPPGVNPLTAQTYLEGKVVEALIKDLSRNIVNPIVLNIGITIAGFHHGIVHPIKVGGRVVGAIAFYDDKALMPQHREASALLAQQAGRIWKGMLEEQGLLEAPQPSPSGSVTVRRTDTSRIMLPSAAVVRYEDLTLDALRRQVLCNDVALDLGDREYDLLAAFVRRPGQVLNREGLRLLVWGDYSTERAALDEVALTIRAIRRKLEGAGSRARLQAVRGNGYELQ